MSSGKSLSSRAAWSPLAAVATLAFSLGLALPAWASLGGDVSSVELDRAHMKANPAMISTTNGYDVHEMHAPSGTRVSEYVSPAGKVFAVSWQGQFPPDMQQILGDYYPQYAAALQAQERHFGHRPLNIQLPGIVIQTGGHMRAYRGRVYVPAMTPQGVTAEEIQ